MNLPLGMLDYPFAHRLGWALLHSLWQGAVIAAFFAISQVCLRRRSANARYLSGCLALLLLLAAPVLTLVSMSAAPSGTSLSEPRPKDELATHAVAALATVVQHVRSTPSHPYALDSCFELVDRTLPWLIQVWAIEVMGFSVRLIFGTQWVRRLTHAEVQPLSPEWLAKLQDLSSRLNITQSVGLLKSSLVEVPLVVGWLRPVILMPASAISGLTPEQLEAILAHELAHVRRHDYLVNLAQTVIETLMFYHPAVWWISHCVREEREHCCDDWVVRVCGNRVSYVQALVSLEEARSLPGLAFAATGGSLLHRVRRLLGTAEYGNPPSAIEFGGLALMALGCALVLVAGWLFLSPNLFQAISLVRVAPVPSTQIAAGTSPFAAGDYYEYFLQTECRVISSPAVLARAIHFLGQLRSETGSEQKPSDLDGLRLLRKRVSSVSIPRTSLIEIRALTSEPIEAARLANAVAAGYRDYRREQRINTFNDSLKTLEERFREQEEKIRHAQEQVDRLRVELKVPNEVVNESMPTVLISAETLRHIEALRIESQSEYVKQKTLFDRLTKLHTKDQPAAIQGAGLVDQQLSEYVQSLSVIDQKLVSLRKELGPENIEVQTAAAQEDELNRKIAERTNGILKGLEAKLASTAEGLSALSNAVLNAQALDAEAATRMQPYFAAKRDLEELVRFRQILQTKIAMEKTDQQLPAPDSVEIVEEAIPPTQSFAADRSRSVVLLGGGAGLILLGLLLARSSRFTAALTKAA
jgi:beta-lactamase regulating signal transducer with metallopeptidase domain/uncharacterized protein involved in exopolysaccharide biosynthesis